MIVDDINMYWNDDYKLLKKIVVSKKNKYYKSVNGVLYAKKRGS